MYIVKDCQLMYTSQGRTEGHASRRGKNPDWLIDILGLDNFTISAHKIRQVP